MPVRASTLDAAVERFSYTGDARAAAPNRDTAVSDCNRVFNTPCYWLFSQGNKDKGAGIGYSKALKNLSVLSLSDTNMVGVVAAFGNRLNVNRYSWPVA